MCTEEEITNFVKKNSLEGSIMIEIFKESDRAAAILGCTLIESRLETLLKMSLLQVSKNQEKLFGVLCPLSSFFSKIELAYRMRLIHPSFRSDVHTMREIRNLIANDLQRSRFNRKPIKDKVIKLIQNKKDKGTFYKLFIAFMDNNTDIKQESSSGTDFKFLIFIAARYLDKKIEKNKL